MTNKAHTAVVNRLLARYSGVPANNGCLDVIAGELLIAVETTATLPTAFQEILALPGTRYIAVTNQDALAEALRLTAGSCIGVMNTRGDIIKAATPATESL